MCVHREQTHQVDAVHDADAQGHVGFGEVDDLLTLRGDGEAGHGQVSFLNHREQTRQDAETHSHTFSRAEHSHHIQIQSILFTPQRQFQKHNEQQGTCRIRQTSKNKSKRQKTMHNVHISRNKYICPSRERAPVFDGRQIIQRKSSVWTQHFNILYFV